ncbi:molecular chaperone [Yersinia sp. 2544 StPb PI]|uniref:fimbrial biogenesis chaperone n=2 Tax=Yersinia TaxID=629 RepID=UPI0009F58E8D|nr:molecular chaperone [Yersinia enterocolitica]
MIRALRFRDLQLISGLLLSLWGNSVFAADGGISLGQTRVVFNETDRARTVLVKNDGDKTYLIQSLVQLGPDNKQATPFIVTPPLFRLEPNSRNLLRIIRQNEGTLSQQHESVFYLSVLAIPAQASELTEQAQLSMGIRFLIKLFYRPDGLNMTPEDAYCKLQFTQVAEGIRVENPTPYFLTLGQLNINHRAVSFEQYPAMIAPHSNQIYPAISPLAMADWRVITDYGILSPKCEYSPP